MAGIKVILNRVCNRSSPDINGSKGGSFLLTASRWVASAMALTIFSFSRGATGSWDKSQLSRLEVMGLATFKQKNVAYRNYVKSVIRPYLDAGVMR